MAKWVALMFRGADDRRWPYSSRNSKSQHNTMERRVDGTGQGREGTLAGTSHPAKKFSGFEGVKLK